MISDLHIPVDTVGAKIRRRRLSLVITLDKLSELTGISKPYLSWIENNRPVNPPKDAKLQLIEKALRMEPGELIRHAHWQRTPPDVRELILKLGTENAALRSAGWVRRDASAGR